MKRLSFFKVLIAKDFNRLLQLPPAFVQKCGSVLPKNVKIRISNGRTWHVTVERRSNRLFWFTVGWRNFAADVGLRFGEFLVFIFDGNFTFQVSVFETSACAKEFPVLSTDAEKVIEKRGGGSGHESNPLCFEMILEPRHKIQIYVPKMFWVAGGMEGKDSVEVEYVANHYYQRVRVGLSHRGHRMYLSTGWSKFRQMNGLVFGKTYLLEFNPTKNVIQVTTRD